MPGPLEVFMRRFPARPLFLAAVSVAVLGSAYTLCAEERPFPADLGGADRFLAHLETDKPLYRPGEIVYGRAAVLDAFTRAPLARREYAVFEVRSPKGDVVIQETGAIADGIAAFSWAVPQGIAGGSYKLVTKFPAGFPSTELAFDVRSYRVPRLKTELEFVRKAYGPGDTVTATLQATRAEGGAPRGAGATAVATVDGVEISRSEVALTEAGYATVTFKLPATIKDGEGTLALVIRDGGIQETAAKTIPIVVTRVRLAAYPEGGDLVQGLESRLYVEARTPRGKPADVAGRIIDASGNAVAGFRTQHEGRGRVAFTPLRAGNAYKIVLDEPAGMSDFFEVPEVKAQGFTLTSIEDSGQAGDPVKLRVASTAGGKARVLLSVREREVASYPLTLEAGKAADAILTPPTTADGVLRATVVDADGLPRAERLVFRKPLRAIQVQVEATPASAGLRDHVQVKITTRDASGKPVPAVVTLSAVDDAVLETVERRERAARLPVQALLGCEVSELMDPTAYLEDGAAGARDMDLLLATQGWRRFAFAEPAKFAAANGDAGDRALAVHRAPMPVAIPRPRRAGGAVPQAWRGKGGEDDGAARPMAAGAPVPAAPPMEKPMDPAPAADALRRADEPMNGDEEKQDFARDARRPRAEAMAKMRAIEVAAIREYAHRSVQSAEASRSDFAETLYWNAGVQTDGSGVAVVAFDLADSVTTIRVKADAFSKDGALGAADTTIEARRPFYLEPRLPLEVTAGDELEIPVALVNGTKLELGREIAASLSGPLTAGEMPHAIALGPEASGRVLLPLHVGIGRGTATVRLTSGTGAASDDVTRTLEVVPAGFPMEISLGGRLEGQTVHTITIPERLSPGSLVTDGAVYPSPLAQLAKAVAALLREPCGCFEQTSSSNYPNVMALQYMSSHQGVDPAIAKRAQALVDAGYKRLVSYECKEKGYEWFGGDPGHEALSAYGVLEFTDMAEVYPVDAGMLARTRAWLLSRRDGKGGYARNPRALDSFGGAPPEITNAYITYALSQAHVPGIEKEIAAVREHALGSEDSYYLALAANVLLDGRDESATIVLDRLAKKQAEDGAVRGASTSITRSGGESLEIETTALSVLAWVRSPAHTARCEKAMSWLLERCKGGRFGSTQATVLALKAIVVYDKAHSTPKKSGAILLVVDGKVYDEAPFTAEREGTIVLPSFAEALTAGEHKVELKLVGGTPMPYSLTVRYNAITPASAGSCKVRLATALGKNAVNEGETVDMNVTLSNATKDGLPMTVGIVGLPGGLEARADQLKELVKQGKIDFFETRGREVVLYLRSMAPAESRSLVISCVAAVPGNYTAPASRAYLYYTDEDKCWVDPVRVAIRPGPAAR
jgi:uncharacterized protein YfaS (alpha-2-macroglobulin family)